MENGSTAKFGMSTVAHSSVTDARRSNPLAVLAALLGLYIVNFADRYLISGLVGPIKQEFGLGDGFMGLLMGPAFVVLYVVMGVPIARLADRSSRILIITCGGILWSAATFATGFAEGPIGLAVARIAVGIGEAAFVAPAYSLLSDYFKPERRAFAFAILGLATYFGQILGQAGGPAIGAALNWRWAFWSIGAIGIVISILAYAIIHEPSRTVAGKAAAPAVPFARILSCLKVTPTYTLSLAAFTLASISGVAFGNWGPELFARSYGLPPVEAKASFALYFGLAGLVGMLAFGAVADRLGRRGMEWPSRLASIAIACATLLTLAITWADSYQLARFLAIPCGLLGGGWSVGMLSTLQYILPAQFRASATALFIAVATLGSQFLGPFLSGLVSEELGGDALALKIALSLVIPVGFVGAACAWLASRRIETDREALTQAAA